MVVIYNNRVEEKDIMKKLSLIFVSVIIALCTGLAFAACGERKYDVTIRVRNNFGSIWTFTPDIDELTYEFSYTGEEMTFWVDAYNLPDHPEWGDQWISPDHEGRNVFTINRLYTAINGNQSHPNSVKERGDYVYTFMADETSNLWNFKACKLRITVI